MCFSFKYFTSRVLKCWISPVRLSLNSFELEHWQGWGSELDRNVIKELFLANECRRRNLRYARGCARKHARQSEASLPYNRTWVYSFPTITCFGCRFFTRSCGINDFASEFVSARHGFFNRLFQWLCLPSLRRKKGTCENRFWAGRRTIQWQLPTWSIVSLIRTWQIFAINKKVTWYSRDDRHKSETASWRPYVFSFIA